jgi:actin-related protein 10
MISSLLITGGTASLPGLIPRLRITLKSKLLPPPDVSSSEAPLDPSMSVHSPQARREEIRQWRKRQDEPYKTLYGLVDKVAILNDPCPIDGSEGISGGGTAPRWTPGLVSWVGGSLAG